MNVGEICTREVVVMDRKESVQEAINLMRQFHVGNVVITESRDQQILPVGIVTDRDILIEVVAKEISPASLMAEDIMSRDLLSIKLQESENEALIHMRSRGVRRAPVINDDGYLEGIISVDDLLEILAENLANIATLISTEQQHERKSRTL